MSSGNVYKGFIYYVVCLIMVRFILVRQAAPQKLGGNVMFKELLMKMKVIIVLFTKLFVNMVLIILRFILL